jgi:glycosyltransferase involved in cell wall biosynthesis
MKISIIQPSRNNLKYLKWSYKSIRKNQCHHDVQICIADDASSDGTADWLKEISEYDNNVSYLINDSGKRLGHTILYDKLINEVAKHDICMIFHADMYLAPHALDFIEKYIRPKKIVSLTRVEPPLHPPGPEKLLYDFGLEPEQFREDEFLTWVDGVVKVTEDKTTSGVFAPWAFFKKDFQDIGGHDDLFAPQSKEDSDIFNRFKLNGVEFIQTWGGMVYHLTCRGNRRNVTDGAPNVYNDNPEWVAQNIRSHRNFIRKWGTTILHDEYLNPIVPHKYNIAYFVSNATYDAIKIFEIWGSTIYVDCSKDIINEYIKNEQPNTKFDLSSRVKHISEFITQSHDIEIYIDFSRITTEDMRNLEMMQMIIADSGEIGSMMIGNFTVNIYDMTPQEMKLIKV